MDENGVVYIRTDKRDFTLETTRSVLQCHFSEWEMEEIDQPFTENTQTALFGDFTRKPGEVDIILRKQV